ncbi:MULTISPECIES: hypothetical protein [unclassified Burkholderia]|uniref:hypothetical protein n=1 Tax=unclassified Burkholderia TaxID=2613784 RepID=UPI002AB249F7|nr:MULTISPECIES: hypothetical protein [unclassified Burkholderia]
MVDSHDPAIRAIDAMEMSDDGQFLLIRGAHPTVTLHRSTFNELLIALPHAIECAERIANDNHGARFAVHSVGWEIGRIGDTTDVIVRFYVPGGAGVGFSVPGEQVPSIVEALCAAAGVTPAMPPVAGITLQ